MTEEEKKKYTQKSSVSTSTPWTNFVPEPVKEKSLKIKVVGGPGVEANFDDGNEYTK